MDPTKTSSTGLHSSALSPLFGNTSPLTTPAPDDGLLQLAAKKSSDAIDMAYGTIRKRLADELQNTIRSYAEKHPELEDNYFVALIADEGYAAEVVPRDQVLASVKDTAKEEAEKILSKMHMGVFKRADFTLHTKNEPVYTNFKATVDSFMQRNKSVFDFLRGRQGSAQVASATAGNMPKSVSTLL